VRVEASAPTGTDRPATKDDAVDVRAARPATKDDAVNVLVTKPLSAPATAAASPAAPATTVAVAADPKIAALRNALLGGEIDVHYQLVFDRHRQPAEVEALVRWHHPESGTLLPGEFLPMARDAGLLSAMTAHVTRRALRDWDALRRDMGVQLSLNGDLELGGEADGLPMLDALLRSRDIDPAMLCWEYPAAQAQRFSDRLREVAGILRSHGMRTAVDGWPIDLDPRLAAGWGVGSIKVDGRDGSAGGLTATFVQSAHAAGLLVGVSGLETEAEVELCRALGVDRFQGYQLARPQPARALVAEPGGSGADLDQR
jgi:EAL domain-containing protein (putative c-di-GMP-specific phosphodiesterase class I)